jgi:hypothetical protein
VFTVSLANAKNFPVTVKYQVVDSTATNANDFVAAPNSGTLTFPSGTAAQTITVLINGDQINEPNEIFLVKLSNATNATIVDHRGVGTIVNDDGPVAFAAPSNLTATATGSTTISLAWKDNSNNESGFKIERKKSGGNFSEIATVGANGNSYNDSALSGGFTYVYRVRAFTANDSSNYSNEASAFTANGSSGNLALHKPITASSASLDQPASYAVDGDVNTYWRNDGVVNSSSPPSWLRVDLGAAKTFGRVIVRWKENYYPTAYEVQVSNDEVSYIAVVGAAGQKGMQDFRFAPATARYVRLYMTKNMKSNYQVAEVEVYPGSLSPSKQNSETPAAAAIPDEFILEQNYPNPFPAHGIFDNPSTQIRFGLPKASPVTIKVYTINGAEIRTLIDDHYPAGLHEIAFNAENLPSGTYFYVMQAGELRQVRRLMLVK